MSAPKNNLFAFDFDGVICDSALETGLSGWKVANSLWLDMPDAMPEKIMQHFRQIRPVMETGYEAILICRLLFENTSSERIMAEFAPHIEAIVLRDQLDISDLKKRFGEYRDNWIENDFSSWIDMNPLYTGIKKLLLQIPISQLYIITTKQERFVSAILDASQIEVVPSQIYGLDRKMKKPEILEDLQRSHPQKNIIFIEDRLPTLLDVLNTPSLSTIHLYFANWGYNTVNDKQQAQSHPHIRALEIDSLTTILN